MTTPSQNHVEIYKRYRPRSWRGLIGQEKVAKSLQSAVKANKLPTAYLFSGPRGCGKTSAALILAKSINCLNPNEATADPCNKCEVCLAINAGNQIGVTYFSAAQRSGVEDVRDLVQQARLSVPIKRQVFIIDEIHNFKQGKGFEALLIPLEEEDMPALFIFCTTEIEKVPQTILSRVQSRRFNLVDAATMLPYVEKIAGREKLELDEDALKAAVRQGRGSVRDTLTALEAIVATGEYTTSSGGDLLEAIASHDLSEALKTIAHANSEGYDGRDLAEQLFEDLRNLLLFASGADPELVGVIPVKDPAVTVKGFYNKTGLTRAMDEVGAALTNIVMGGDARIHLEIGIVKTLNQLARLKKALESR